ncbi:zinc-binding loop region of homing endonuclease domain-containing protein [Trichoderma sp. SZMC 28014]
MDEQDAQITVPELHPVVKGLLDRLPDDFWELSESFWTPLRHCLGRQQEAIQHGRQALEQAQQALYRSERENEQTQRAIKELLRNTVLAQISTIPKPIPRSNTPDLVLDARLRIKQELNSMCAIFEPDAQLAMLKTLPPEWARDKLESTRTVSLDNDAGCWFSDTKPKKRQYTILSLYLTPHPSQEGFVGLTVYRHRLALVAKGEAPLLALSPRDYDISPLCHNEGCFRPEHLEMEPIKLNRVRSECRGKSILTLPDGGVLHPCPHWDWQGSQGYQKCVLPVEYIPENKYLELGSNGKYKDIRSDHHT